MHAGADCFTGAPCASALEYGIGVGLALLLLAVMEGDVVKPRRQPQECNARRNLLPNTHSKESRQMANTPPRKMKSAIGTLLCAFAMLSGCATSPTAALDDAEWQAIRVAEQYVLRHGYTPVGHPADKPVVGVDVLDSVRSNQQKVSVRRGRLEARAACVVRLEGEKQYVLFRRIADRDSFGAVYVADAKAVQVMHQPVGTDPRCIWL